MRVLMTVLAMDLVCAAAPAAQDDMSATSNSCPPTVSQLKPVASVAEEDAFNMAFITTYYCINKDAVCRLRDAGWSWTSLYLLANISVRTGQTIESLAQMRADGMSWSQIASKLSMCQSDFTRPISRRTLACMPCPPCAVGAGPDPCAKPPCPTVSKDEENLFNQAFLAMYYCIPNTMLSKLRDAGWNWQSIYLLANVAARTSQPIETIAMMRSNGMSWNDIACKFNVPAGDFVCPVVATTATSRVGAGPSYPQAMYDWSGNMLLDAQMVHRLYCAGYDWLDVAIAANFARDTGYPIDWVLAQTRNGMVWDVMIRTNGLDRNRIYNVTSFPFERKSIYSQSMQDSNHRKIAQFQVCGEPKCPPSGLFFRTPTTFNF